MEYFWILILVLFFATNLMDKAKSVQLEELEELPLQTFDELFVDEWLDKDEAEGLKMPAPTNFGQNVRHKIDRQNTQIGQIEPNSTDQLRQIGPNSTDQLGQIEPNSTDQNPPLTESDHTDNAKNGEEMTSNKKRKIIAKFNAIKDEFKQKGKYSAKERTKIEEKIAKHLNANRKKIYKWKKEFGLSRKVFYEKEERKHLIDKFDQKKAELKRAGFKNSQNKLDKTVAKELGLSFLKIYQWKKQLGQTEPNHKYSHSEQKVLMKRYYEIKGQNSKNSDKDIAKMLKIGRVTLFTWKKQFKRYASNFQEIGGSNSGSI